MHARNAPVHTKIGEVLPQEMYEKCVREREKRAVMPKSVRRGNHWYTRHLMWQNAVRVRERPEFRANGALEFLEDLTLEERKEALCLVDCL